MIFLKDMMMLLYYYHTHFYEILVYHNGRYLNYGILDSDTCYSICRYQLPSAFKVEGVHFPEMLEHTFETTVVSRLLAVCWHRGADTNW